MGKESGIDKDLLAFVSGLDSRDDADSRATKKKKTVSPAESTSTGGNVSIADLTAALDDEMGFANLKKRIGNIVDAETSKGGAKVEIVAAPLADHERARLERQAAYGLSAKEVNKWIPVVRANRNAKALSFPAEAPRAAPTANEALVADFAPKTSLEQSISELLKRSGMESEEGIVKAEQMELAKLTPEEVEKRYRELTKKRALLFFAERKSKRQAKIKSKAYRKVVKKERERRIVKEAEASGARLTEEEIREERMKAELERIRERMSLKTRKASKWAHELLQKKRMEAGSREEVMQQVRDKDRLRQEILGKAAQYKDDLSGSDLDSENADAEAFERDEEDEGESEDSDAELPLAAAKSSSKGARRTRRMEDDYIDECSDGGDSDEHALSSAGEADEVDDIFNKPKEETAPSVIGRRSFAPTNALNKTIAEGVAEASKSKKSAKRKKTFAAATTTVADLQSLFVAEEEADVELDEKTRTQLATIRQAFAGDNVFAEFEAKKQAEIEAERPKDIDLTLPGWGTWGGIGIEAPKGKIILKGKDGVDPSKRKDANLKHVIIHERRGKKVAKLMVEKPPFPFRTREEYEASLGKPMGKEWNSATAFKQKIRPRVQVKVGSIIDPIKFVKQPKQ